MIVNWTETSMNVIPISPELSTKLNGKSEVVLYPGYNEIDDAVFEAIKPHIKLDLELKRIRVATLPSINGKPPEPLPANEIHIDKLVTMLSKTVNIDTLKDWLRNETRLEERVAIQKRIEELETELKKGGHNSKPKAKPEPETDDEV